MANDRYRDNQTTAIAAAGVLASALVVLGAGALHPVVLYLIIAASGVITVIFGLLTWREFTRRKEAKAKMEAAAVTTPFQMFLTVTPGSSANVTYRDPGRPSSAAVP
ncbi:MAG TPA: hypothetical protein VG123_05830 [Streptosporangiaceae bacterium]|nr:hypothetical protein [Streptosporangiaceae bacterium]